MESHRRNRFLALTMADGEHDGVLLGEKLRFTLWGSPYLQSRTPCASLFATTSSVTGGEGDVV